ncbi:unnamed protein product [Boreogadus saida]
MGLSVCVRVPSHRLRSAGKTYMVSLVVVIFLGSSTGQPHPGVVAMAYEEQIRPPLLRPGRRSRSSSSLWRASRRSNR